MNIQKKDEHVLNELFDDFETQEQEKKSSDDTNMDIKDRKPSIKKGVILMLSIGIALIIFGSFVIRNNELSDNYENNVYIEPNNQEDISKVEKPLVYTEFFHDPSWGSDITQSKFSNYWGEENIEIQSDKSIKVTYPEGTYKPSINPRGGAGFLFDIGGDNDELALSYDLEFADNFDFVRGGKLPGLCGGDCPRGGLDSDKGFSVRFSWKKDGFLDTYSVLPGSSKFGDYSSSKMFQFKAGNKYNIKQEIKLNTPGSSDGILQVFVNGKSVYLNTTMVFRTDANILINTLLFNTFFGGSDESWATPKETYIVFNNLKIEK